MSIGYLTHCLPDYFRGHHNTVLQVPVTNKTTSASLVELITSEYASAWDHYTGDHLSEEDKKYYGCWPDLTDEELKLALEALISDTEPDKPLFHFIEDEQEEDEDFNDSVYAFFIWEEDTTPCTHDTTSSYSCGGTYCTECRKVLT